MADNRRFEYLLNAMELAALAPTPADAGFAHARLAVLSYVATLETENARLRDLRDRIRDAGTHASIAAEKISDVLARF